MAFTLYGKGNSLKLFSFLSLSDTGFILIIAKQLNIELYPWILEREQAWKNGKGTCLL
ncbi:hypothetical protein [Candidatus Formimonas warabiya]|uniref:hypothetical protein n=1 Tax=Formimonas warabiya TaxID=1761012 RepID=UPI001BE448FB|nr:hypothetical protein [Candidatus Formimonas warabiya]